MTVFLDVQYTQEYKELELPALDYAISGDVGIDLFCMDNVTLMKEVPQLVRTGIRVAVPNGCGMFLFPKSGRSLEGITLSNCVGVIDPSYRGEVKASLVYMGPFESINLTQGIAVVQFIILPCPTILLRETNQLDPTERGEGGFGHTRK